MTPRFLPSKITLFFRGLADKAKVSAKPPFRKDRTDSRGRRNWQPRRKDYGRVESQMYNGHSRGSVGNGSQFLRDRRSGSHSRESNKYTGCFNRGLKNHNINTYTVTQ